MADNRLVAFLVLALAVILMAQVTSPQEMASETSTYVSSSTFYEASTYIEVSTSTLVEETVPDQVSVASTTTQEAAATTTVTVPGEPVPVVRYTLMDLGLDKTKYTLGETISMHVVSGNFLYNLWIKAPSGWLLAVSNGSEDTEYEYSPSAPGRYLATAEFFYRNSSKAKEIARDFTILSPGETSGTSTTRLTSITTTAPRETRQTTTTNRRPATTSSTMSSSTTSLPDYLPAPRNQTGTMRLQNGRITANQGDTIVSAFETGGTGDLLILPVNGTTYGDLEFTGLACGGQDRTGDAYLVLDDMLGILVYAAVPFFLLPVSFVFLLRRRLFAKAYKYARRTGQADMRSMLVEYDSAMSDSRKGPDRKSLQSLKRDNLVYRLSRPSRDLVSQLASYDLEISRRFRALDVLLNVVTVAFMLTLVSILLTGLTAYQPADSGMASIHIDGRTYFLTPYGEPVNASYRVVGVYLKNYSCEGTSYASFKAVTVGGHVLECRFGDAREQVSIDVSSLGIATSTESSASPVSGASTWPYQPTTTTMRNGGNVGSARASISTDKQSYSVSETVKVGIYDPGNLSWDLWIKEPSGWLLALQNYSGSTDYEYSSSVPGNYSVMLETYSGGKTVDLYSKFDVRQAGSEGMFAGAGLSIDKSVYSVDESVYVNVSAGNLSYDLWVRDPSGWLLAMENVSGDSSYLYSASVPGNYTVKADYFYGGLVKEINQSFVVTYPTAEVTGVVNVSYVDVSAMIPVDAVNISVYESGNLTQNVYDVKVLAGRGLKVKVYGLGSAMGRQSSKPYANESESVQGRAVAGEAVNWTMHVGNSTIRYGTPAPVKKEDLPVISGDKWTKKVRIDSNASIHYYNVTTYSDYTPRRGAAVRLYLIVNGSRIDVTDDSSFNASFVDSDGDGVTDRILWTVPQLSSEEFEIEVSLTVLNLHSYPLLGGNWTVMFNTTGAADLWIRAFNGTSWTNDVNGSGDLLFLELRCGDGVIGYDWVNDSVHVSNYSCADIGYETSKELSVGQHTLEFRFGDIIKYAYNTVSNVNFTGQTAENGTTITINSSQVNISTSITGASLDTFRFDWNGSNYSVYDSSLLLALNFNNNSAIGDSATKAVDISKYGNNGTISSAAWSTSGRFGGAMNFPGSADVDFGTLQLGTTTNLTIEFWENQGSALSWRDILAFGDPFFRFETASPVTTWYIYNSGISSGTPAFSIIAAGQWQHIAFTSNSTNWSVYVNGVSVTSGATTGGFTGIALTLGDRAPSQGDSWVGYLDEVRIYNRTLTPKEIWLQYQSEFQKYNTTTYLFYSNLTNLTNGTYTYYGWANDTAGFSAYTNAYTASSPRYLTVGGAGTTPPVLNFTAPTAENGSTISVNSSQVNISITEQNLDTFKFDWNGTNYSIYDSSLLLAVNFNNNSNIGDSATTAKDISKYGNNGTITVSSWSTSGRFGGCMYFNSFANTAFSSPPLGNTTNLTIEFWENQDGGAIQWSDVLAFGNPFFRFETTSTVTTWNIYNSGISSGTPSFSIIAAGQWEHIAFVSNTTNWIVYVNAVNASQGATNGGFNGGALTLGDRAPGYGSEWIGYLDEVRIYNRTLTPMEIWLQYQSEFQKYSSTTYLFYSNLTNLTSGTYTYYGWANDTAGNSAYTNTYTASSPRYLNPVSPVQLALNYTAPTAENGSTISANSTQVNISVSEQILDTFRFDWNGMNYSVYDSSLVLALSFNNNSAIGENSTYVVDFSSFGNNLTLYNGTQVCGGNASCPTFVSGRFGSALDLDGVNDMANTSGVSFNYNFENSTTLSFWIKVHSMTGTYPSPFVYGASSSDGWGYWFDAGDSQGCFGIGNVSYNTGCYAGFNVFSTNVWNQVAYVYDKSNHVFKRYTNGGFQESVDTSVTKMPDMRGYNRTLKIGGHASYPFNGSIDEVRIYTRALNASEIWLLYQSEFQKYNSTTYLFYSNLTNLSSGAYTYYGWANDTAGNSTYTNTYNASSPRYLTVSIGADITPPALNFSAPTAENGTTKTANSSQVNISITEQSLDTFNFDWNGTNYSIFDSTLRLALNLNNNSAIGENSTYFVDSSSYGNNGTCVGSLSCPAFNSSGRFGGAYMFDGTDYISVPHTPSLNITGGLTIEAWALKQGNLSVFGTGSDGAVTISAKKNIVSDVIAAGRTYPDGVATAVSVIGKNNVSVVNATGFAAGDEALLMDVQGNSTYNVNAGNYEFLGISSVTGSTIVFSSSVFRIYGASGNNSDLSAQKVVLQRVPQYTDVTIQSGGNLTVSAWNGSFGGVIVFKASGTVTVNSGGYINVGGAGFAGGLGGGTGAGYSGSATAGNQGSSLTGNGSASQSANGGGGGGGSEEGGYWDCYGCTGGGGAGYASAGTNGVNIPHANGGTAGASYGLQDLTRIYLGSGGGGGGAADSGTGLGSKGGKGGAGGGLIYIRANQITVSGAISANGTAGGKGVFGTDYAGGGGAGGSGGSLYLYMNSSSLGTGLITASAGAAGPGLDTGGSCAGHTDENGSAGGTSSSGRVAVYYLNYFTGSTSPTTYNGSAPYTNIVSKEDSYGLGFIGSTAGGYVSNKSISFNVSASGWVHVAMSYNGTMQSLYINGLPAANQAYTGSINSTGNNLSIGRDAVSYFNGTLDEVRIYNRSLSDKEIWLQYQSEFQKYNSSTYLFYSNLTNLTNGTYTYYGWANDTSGNSAYTNTYTASSPRYLTVGAHQPSVGVVVVNDSDAGFIQTFVTDDAMVYCNATVTDAAGYQDVSTNGMVNATLYHQSSTPTAADDKNDHYTNSSCSFTGGSGKTVTAVCAFTLEHEALNGTWTCNVTAKDSSGNLGSNTSTNQVDQLIAVNISETGIRFGTMAPGTNSSVANSTNISNVGNVLLDIGVFASGDMSCTSGSIGMGNISFNYTSGNYDSMVSKKLSNTLQVESSFDLGIEGVATAEGVPSTKNEYWTLNVPSGVRGNCSNTINVAAVVGQ